MTKPKPKPEKPHHFESYYAIRYLPGIPLKERKHQDILGSWHNFEDAEAHRQKQPNAHQTETVWRERKVYDEPEDESEDG